LSWQRRVRDLVRTPPAELDPEQQKALVLALGAALEREDGAAPRHIETHISHVLLHGGFAYKIKKAIATSFLDQSSLARRRHACAEELRLNRRLAPDLYLDVIEIVGPPDSPRFALAGGEAAAMDVAVRMRVFDEQGLWDRLAATGALRAADIDDLAARIATFHAQAAVLDGESSQPLGQPGTIRQVMLDSLADLQTRSGRSGWPDAQGLAQLARLRAWEAEAFPFAEPVMRTRRAAGHVRECHGDLHLGNVAREGGRCLVFDGIEFNDAFRWIDVIDEIAFMAMDLHAHGLPALAHRFVNACLEANGDYDGVRLLPYYLVSRALVRAKVAQLRVEQSCGAERLAALAEAKRYLDLALSFCSQRPRALIITHGLPGSGKTTLTQGLLEAAGAVRVRADIERKRLAGLQALHRSASPPGGGIYSIAMNEATQARLLQAAADVVDGGSSSIVDATFIRRAVRDEARQCAARLGVPMIILRFTASPQVLRERVRERSQHGSDASEADESVLEAMMQALEPLQSDELAQTFEVPGSNAPSGCALAVDWDPLLARLHRNCCDMAAAQLLC
jgi:uncharacterized protein